MSTIAHATRLQVPGDEDLDELYQKVLEGFTETLISPSLTENEVNGVPDSAASDYHRSPWPESPSSPRSAISQGHSIAPQPAQIPPTVQSSTTTTRPTRRPLPPTPNGPPTIPFHHLPPPPPPPLPPTSHTPSEHILPPPPPPPLSSPPTLPPTLPSHSPPALDYVNSEYGSLSSRDTELYSSMPPSLNVTIEDHIRNINEAPDDIPPESPAPEYTHNVKDDSRAVVSLGFGPDGPFLAPQHRYSHPPSEPYSPALAPSLRYQASRELLEGVSSPWASSVGHVEAIEAYNNASTMRPVSTETDSILAYIDEAPPQETSATSDESNWRTGDVMEITVGRMNSTGSYASRGGSSDWEHSSSTSLARRPSNALRTIMNFAPYQRDSVLPEDQIWEEDDDDETRYINYSLLSNLAVLLRDKVPRGTHVKGSIPYPRAFTGKDVVTTIQAQIQRELDEEHGGSTDRGAALQIARSLQSQLYFYEVEWGGRILQDGVEDVYMFLDDEGGGEELPTGVVTFVTRCYSPMCEEGIQCYSNLCPRRGHEQLPSTTDTSTGSVREEWSKSISAEFLKTLSDKEISRQTVIHKIISKEEQYLQDLNLIESLFIKPLRSADPPIMPRYELEDFIDEVFGNILEIREGNRRLLEVLYVRQREEAPVIQRVGDIFLDAATEFWTTYPAYIGHHPIAEKRMREEQERNPQFRLFIESCSRKQSARSGESPRLDLKHYLDRPREHLQKYPVLLEAVQRATEAKNPDRDFLMAAADAMKNLQDVAELRIFQAAMGKGPTSKWEWHDLLPPQMRRNFTSQEEKRQSVIFELIKGEMSYVKDLESIETMYVQPLREADPPIVPRERLEQFIQDVFHNSQELYAYHRRLVDKFHEIQRDEHPRIRSITAAIFDAALNFREAYMEYIPNYPIAAYRIDDEMENNTVFHGFVQKCIRHSDAHRLDMKSFINRPIPRLLRYELLLKGILEVTPPGHEDHNSIPQVIDVIKALGKETEPGVSSAKQKVELWRYNSNLVFKIGESIDMDLLNNQRSLVHSGKLLRQPESEWSGSGWSEMFVLLFDNYLVMTKPKEKDRVMKYHVNRRPIPLDLLTLVNFNDPPTARSTGILGRTLRSSDRQLSDTSSVASPTVSVRTGESSNVTDPRTAYPFAIHHNGRLGGPYILYAESAQARTEWKQKLEEALGLRKVVQESNKVFEIETLSIETFLVPHMSTGPSSPAWSDGTIFTGKVTCSVPFNTADGRGLVAIGCAEGVWIGFRHDSRSMRRVLHLKMVTQCAMLEDFGLFLVLADKQLFAYHIEALVPTNPNIVPTSQTPQKLHESKNVHFFSVGTMHGRTLVIYMKKKGTESVFRVVEPVIDKINEPPRAPGGLKFLRSKSDWFRDYREFLLPSESYDLIFLKAKIAILCAKGFEIMDMVDFESVTIPQREDPRLSHLAKRYESCRPLAMFRRTDDEFLLCYDEFGIFVNKRGDPITSAPTIEWEGRAERVALHAPYILLFDHRFIEIRHFDTGRLAQIIPGKDVRCIWDGRGVDSSAAVIPAQGSEENMVQEPRVHAVMSITEPVLGPNGRPIPMRGVTQHVFELVPTIPLYLPGSLSSPSGGNYFSHSYSPPRSPRPRASSSYRS